MTAAQAVRFAAVVVVAASYPLVLRTGEARVAAARADEFALSQRLRDARIALASAPFLARDRERARGRARRARGAHDDVARFVAGIARAAAARHAAVTAIVAAGAPTAPSLDVTLEGRFADVLTTIRALSDGDVPGRVRVDALSASDTARSSVTASVRVTVEAPAGREAARAASR